MKLIHTFLDLQSNIKILTIQKLSGSRVIFNSDDGQNAGHILVIFVSLLIVTFIFNEALMN